MAPDILVLERQRDAWATIRGFAYQVDQTIDRWLDLGDQDALDLEAGEDIDYVTAALTGESAAVKRLLEQVKHRDVNITLRSDASREALANFLEHRRLNPTLTLSFRFTTTATVGRERDSPLPGKMPGIHAWKSIQQARFAITERDAVLSGLRQLLITPTRPPGFSDVVWHRFVSWANTAPLTEFEDFVNRFDWAIASADSPSLAKLIRARLRSSGYSENDADSQRIYEHLFARVFSLLSSHGSKRLTRADLAVSVETLDTHNAIVFGQLRGLHELLAGRVESLENRVVLLTAELADAVAGLAGLSTRISRTALDLAAGDAPVIDLVRLTPPPLTEPPDVPYASSRHETLDAQFPVGAPVPPVIALYGAQASGKSQLALQLARRLGSRRIWVPFLNLSVDRATERLAVAISSATGKPMVSPESWDALCTEFATHVDVVVLDDVPSFRRGEDFGVRLAVLTDAVARHSGHLVLTSVTRVGVLQIVAGNHRALSVLVSPLTSNEVAEVLMARGAPDVASLVGVAHLIHGVTRGHPVLVQAVAEYVARRKWHVTDRVLHDLFGNRYAREVNHETIRALLQSVSDSDTRALLYRLTIADIEFERADVDIVTAAPPPIDRAMERFTSVLGPWVEASGNDRYRLSQLVRSLGPVDVATETQRACHAGIARRILARRRLSEADALSVIGHFVAAREFDDAAMLLVQGLQSLSQASELPSHWGRLWSALVVPAEANAPLRLQAYALQAVIAKRSGKDPTTALRAAREILADEVTLPAWAAFVSALTVAIAFALDDAEIAAPFMRRALSEHPNLPAEMQTALIQRSAGQHDGFETLVWLVGAGVRDSAALGAWLDALAALPGDVRASALKDPLAQELAGVIFGRIAIREWERPEGDRRWGKAASVLADAAERARQLNSPVLDGGATGCEMSCRFEAGEPTGDITARATIALDRLLRYPNAAFLVAKHVGLGAYDRGEKAIALQWLRAAAGMSSTHNAVDRVHVHVRLSELLMGSEPSLAVSHAERAVGIARRFRPLLETLVAQGNEAEGEGSDKSSLVIQALAELSTAQWLTGVRSGAALTLVDVIDRLVTAPRDDDEWRTLFVRVGHATGYTVTVLATGKVPQRAQDDSPYLAPFLGMFVQPPDAATAALYDPAKFHMLSVHAMLLAELAGDDARATQWAARAATDLKRRGFWIAAMIPLSRLVRDSIERDAFVEAFEYGEDMLTALWTRRGVAMEDVQLLSPTPSPPAPRAIVRVAERRQFDAQVLDHVFLPATVRLAFVSRRDPARGRRLAAEVRDICLRLRTGDDGSDLWKSGAQLVTAAFIDGVDVQALVDLGDLHSADDERTLRALAYLAASLHPRADLRAAIHLQLNIAEYLTRKLSLGSRTNERIAIPLIEVSWRERFDNARFLFQTPKLVEAGLRGGSALDPMSRLRSVLRTIADGLGVPVPAGARDWFSMSTPD